MLIVEMTKTISGRCEIEGAIVASMHCSLGETAGINTTTNIVNRKLYDQNKEAVQADIDEFTKLCRAEEDAESNVEVEG